MAFPAPTSSFISPVHTEGGKKFVAKSGKWEKRPGCRVWSTELSGSGKTVSVFPDAEATRLQVHAVFRMAGDGYIQTNFRVNGTPADPHTARWLTPNSDDYLNVSGDLTNGTNSWRKGNEWKTAKPPPATGIYLNWLEDSWRVGHTQRGFAEIEVCAVDSGFSVLKWVLLAMKLNEYPFKTEGCANVYAVPSMITGIAFNTSSGFSEGSLVAEVF